MTAADPCPAGCLTPISKPLAHQTVTVVDAGAWVTMDKYKWREVKRWLRRYGGARVMEVQPNGRTARRSYGTRPGPKSKKVTDD